MKLVVGLGNPGQRYAETRHNAGFRVVSRLAEQRGLAFDPRFGGALAIGTTRASVGAEPVGFALFEPMAFMNRSGEPTAAAWQGLGSDDPARDLLVVYDDLDLPIGDLRLRKKGGHGGHNGLRDVIDALGTAAFPRLRFGIGRPPSESAVLDHVLAPFAPSEASLAQSQIDRAAEAIGVFLVDGMDAAMNRFNGSLEEGGDVGQIDPEKAGQ